MLPTWLIALFVDGLFLGGLLVAGFLMVYGITHLATPVGKIALCASLLPTTLILVSTAIWNQHCLVALLSNEVPAGSVTNGQLLLMLSGVSVVPSMGIGGLLAGREHSRLYFISVLWLGLLLVTMAVNSILAYNFY